jgi:hypothetical protein
VSNFPEWIESSNDPFRGQEKYGDYLGRLLDDVTGPRGNGTDLFRHLSQEAERRGLVLQDLEWRTDKYGEYWIEPIVMFRDGARCQPGIRIKKTAGTPEAVYQWIKAALAVSFDDALKQYGERKEEEKRQRKLAERRTNPDIVMPIVGFRQWRVSAGRIGPIGNGAAIWRQGPEWTQSECTSGLHMSPGPRCHCGFNAWFRPDRIVGSEFPMVGGIMLGKGVIEVHEQDPPGFRSEYGKPLAFTWTKPEDEAQVRELGKSLNIPVVPFDMMETFAVEHGLVIHDWAKDMGSGDEEAKAA